jgi:hypothetical protein
MDSELKQTLMDDLARFVKRKDYYKRIGKAWKRGYLLYGPPGTGSSSSSSSSSISLSPDRLFYLSIVGSVQNSIVGSINFFLFFRFFFFYFFEINNMTLFFSQNNSRFGALNLMGGSKVCLPFSSQSYGQF